MKSHVTAAAVLVLFAGCAINPVTKRPEVTFVSEAKEREMGREEAAKVKASIGLVEDSELTEYVTQVGARLVANSPGASAPFEFHVVDMVEPNAFALPGGYVYVSRGLLALANSEDELANVVGHEVGHVLARHASQRLTLATPFAIISGIGGLATGIVSPTLGRIVAGATSLPGGLLLASYSRDQEREADDVGMQLAAKSGWDPAAMSSFMRTLQREETLRTGGKQRRSFFASHPTTPERAANTATIAASLSRGPANPVAADRDAFLDRLEGLLVGANPAVGVFVDSNFLHPEIGFALTFPEGWQTENAPAHVAAGPEAGNAAVMFTGVEKGDDPMITAQRIGKQFNIDPDNDLKRWRVDGEDAVHLEVRTRVEGRLVQLDLTWVAHEGTVYQVLGLCEPADFAEHRIAFHDVARSFHRMTAAERKSITATRLRIKEARDGETAGDVARRFGSAWSAEEVALANGVEVGAKLEAGRKVKIAISEPWK